MSTAQGSTAGIRSVAVFTGSSTGTNPVYAEAAARAAALFASRGVTVVYGGGNVGLMGVVADAALAAGGDVIGVMPQALSDRELEHPGLTRLETVGSMHERKQRMADLSDAFVAFPGGAGTLEELFEVWTWQHLGIHTKPVALLNTEGFWNPLLAALDHMVAEGFTGQSYRDALIVEKDAEALLTRMGSWSAPQKKWTTVRP